jgi:predicted protein tyrosine phosphatase
MITWGRLYFCDGKKHKLRMIEMFRSELEEKEIIVLNIPDDYKFMDTELIDEIKAGVDSVINHH